MVRHYLSLLSSVASLDGRTLDYQDAVDASILASLDTDLHHDLTAEQLVIWHERFERAGQTAILAYDHLRSLAGQPTIYKPIAVTGPEQWWEECWIELDPTGSAHN